MLSKNCAVCLICHLILLEMKYSCQIVAIDYYSYTFMQNLTA